MDQRLRVIPKKAARSPRLLAFIIVLIVGVLSYAMLSIWSHQGTKYAHRMLSLPKLKLRSKAIDPDKLTEDHGWTIYKTQSGDTLSSIFKQVGLSRKTLQEVITNNQHAKTLTRIKPEQQLQFLIRNQQLEKLLFPVSTTEFLVVTHKDKTYTTAVKARKMNTHDEYITATVSGSLFGTAKRLGIPYKLVHQMTEIFNWEIDFLKDVRPGDQFSIVYQAYYIDDKLVSTGNILAVMYTNRGKKYQAVRHETTAGDYDYFTPEGTSLRKAFSRYPIRFSHISSSYSLSRYHPILHYRRAHKGVDLAASIGTPIHATGNGRIQVMERHSGYGNMIKIVHDKTHASLYAHMLKFQKGLAKGDRVKRGQVIGYVGQTGLADGPHCHYEFHINNQPRNPTTISLPRSSPIAAHEMGAFKMKSNAILAHLKLYEEASLAAAGKKTPDTA